MAPLRHVYITDTFSEDSLKLRLVCSRGSMISHYRLENNYNRILVYMDWRVVTLYI